jgi:hypothetical protein
VQRLGIFTLLGDSVRVVAKDLQEVMFKDVGMDDIALDQAQAAAQALLPQAQVQTTARPSRPAWKSRSTSAPPPAAAANCPTGC